MASFKITSEVHAERSRSHENWRQNYVVTQFAFAYPPHMKPKNSVKYDHEGDLVLQRKEGKLLIEHSICTQLELVGLQLWRGAFLLADYIMANPQEFEHQNVVELGSGVGLTSIAAAMLAREVTCTDIDLGEILPLIKRNVERNSKYIRGKFNVMALNFKDTDWPTSLKRKLAESRIILAADVIYDDSITDHFVSTLEKILHSDDTKRTVYVALEKRFVFTIAHLDSVAPSYEEFRRCIARRRLKWTLEEVNLNFPQYFKYDRVKELVLIKIHKT
ncbi:methyltransferase-like protein 22 isoform X1 [Diachasmimorpha longicaudata]|uniref:methyltransferase-like protein 22 isoform X1 n=1 Tax=Diachasmimorpha longicaudata TaxID=58733 RepID=UPI0030B8847A